MVELGLLKVDWMNEAMTSLPIEPVPRTERAPQGEPWALHVLVLGMLGAVLFICALVGLVVVFQASYADRILPGVYAFGVPLGGMTPDEAQRVLADKFTYDDSAVFTFRDNERFWQFSAGELGVQYDPAQTIAQAYGHGRTGAFVDDLVTQALTWLNSKAIEPVVTYDQNVAVSQLERIATEINQQSASGFLKIEGTNVTAAPTQTGRALDITATLAQLNAVIGGLTTGAEIPLVVRELPVSLQGVELAEARARAALSGPLTLTTDDSSGQMLGPWAISVDQIAASLRAELVQNPDGTQSYDIRADFSAFADYLRDLAPGLLTAPQDGRFHFNESTRQLEVIKPSSGGRRLNIDATIARLQEQVFSTTERTVSLVYDYEPARYHEGVTAQELGITELVAESTTYYRGSPSNRRTNIAVSASRFDGVILAPGEEFSFNRILGDISPESGFLEDKLIFGGRTILGIGGGVCQVSTTAFRAAFYGGFTIIERNSHGYRVGYYEQNGHPPGLDAAIWQPERDFRFQNDTPYHLLIEVSLYPSDDSIQFRFYSTPTGRIVDVETPRVANITPPEATRYEANSDLQLGEVLQVDYAAEGADVNVTRTITYPDGTVKKDNIFTHYLPWGAIFQVAPGDSRLSG